MNYYELRRRATARVDKMNKEGHTEEEIVYSVGLDFGFGEKFVMKRLDLILKMQCKQQENE